MVFVTLIRLCSASQAKAVKKLKIPRFLDTLVVNAKGGSGGQGLEKFGGFGGKGGNVYLVGQEKITLAKLKKEILETQKKLLVRAGTGLNSSKHKLIGDQGEDKEVPVPPGVSIKTNKGQLIGEILEVGEKLLVAKGGDGGQPSNGFVSQRGHFHTLVLDLKLIADIGLVGFPNAGKSSLVKSLSNLKTKIQPYPFTTIHPQVGTMIYKDNRQITVADLPGLVEGAHEDYGMGHSFLKHMERTKLLLFVVDLCGFQFKPDDPHRDAFETVAILLKEMELAKSELLSKPAVLALNKIDLPGTGDNIKETTHKLKHMNKYFQELSEEIRPDNEFKFEEVFCISARNRRNVDSLKDRLRVHMDVLNDKERETELAQINNNLDKYFDAKFTEHSSGKLV